MKKILTIFIMIVILFTLTAGSLFAGKRNLDSPLFRMTANAGFSNFKYIIEDENGDYEVVNGPVADIGLGAKWIPYEFLLLNTRGNLSYNDAMEFGKEAAEGHTLILDTDIIVGLRFKKKSTEWYTPFLGFGIFYEKYSTKRDEWRYALINQASYLTLGIILEGNKLKNERLNSTFGFRVELLLPLDIIYKGEEINFDTGEEYIDELDGDSGIGFKLGIEKLWYIGELALGYGISYNLLYFNKYKYPNKYHPGEYITKEAKRHSTLKASIKIGW